MFSNAEIKREALDIQIKEEQILDGNSPRNHGTAGYTTKENRSDLRNSSIGYMIDDLIPRIKRPRSNDRENVTTSKRMRRSQEMPNFRRPWPKIQKSVPYPTSPEGNVTHSYTNFTISNIINDDNSNSREIESDKYVQQKSSYFHDMPRIYDHVGNRNIIKNIESNGVNVNIAKTGCNYESRIISEVQNDLNITNDSDEYENESVHENSVKSENYVHNSRNVSEVQNDLNITNDSDEYENEYVNEKSVKSVKYVNNSTNKDTNQEVETQPKQNDSNLIWTIQNTNPEKLKLVISKDNNNTYNSKKAHVEEGYNWLDRDEQPVLLPNKQTANEHKSDRKRSRPKHLPKLIKLEPSSTNVPVNHTTSLKVNTPLREIKKKKSKSKRHSLPNISDMKSQIIQSENVQVNEKKIVQPPTFRNKSENNQVTERKITQPSSLKNNQSENNQVTERKITQPPSFKNIKSENNQVKEKKGTQPPARVFMKKLTWKNISQKEKIITEARVKVHKMILNQDDGSTTEIAVKAHLEKLDWTELGLAPKAMVIEEGAMLANLQGIKGVPYLCGVIIEDPPALVMSYYKGRTIGDYLEEGDTFLALKTFIRTCETVSKIHHRGWAHYDIHADNILGRVNYNNHVTVTLLHYGFCRATHVNPHYGIYIDPEDLEGHHLPVDIINKNCNGSYVDRFSLCYILEEINDKIRETSETNAIRDAASLGLMTDHPHLRPSATHLAQLAQKLVSKHTCDSWNLNIDD